MKKYLFFLAALIPAIASAAVKTQLVTYKQGAAYNQQAAERAWKAMSDFFNEIFKTAAR